VEPFPIAEVGSQAAAQEDHHSAPQQVRRSEKLRGQRRPQREIKAAERPHRDRARHGDGDRALASRGTVTVGTVWFTQETKGNAASITNAGVITEGKAVKGSGIFGITVAPCAP
jgi:hypothetical protein